MSNMFDDIDFDMPLVSKNVSVEQPAAAAKTKAPVKEMEVEGLETPRDMLGDLDGLLSQLDEQKMWQPKYAKGEEVEARWDEDEMWYTAKIDAVHQEIERYELTFTEYGNSQVTEEENIKPSLQRRLAETEAALAPAVEAEMKKKKERRDSFIALHPELAGPSPEELERMKKREEEDRAAKLKAEEEEEARVKAGEDVAEVSMEEALASGVLTPEQRKKLIAKMAQKMGADAADGASQRTLVDVSKIKQDSDDPPMVKEKAMSERVLLKKDPSKGRLKQRSRSNSLIEFSSKPPSGGKANAIVGNADIDSLLKQEQEKSRQRSESESAIKFAEEQQRKVWSDNNLLRETKRILSQNL